MPQIRKEFCYYYYYYSGSRNDDDAKKTLDNILTKFGWETIDIGGIEGARLLEPLAFLWIMHYFRTGNGNHAFKLSRK